MATELESMMASLTVEPDIVEATSPATTASSSASEEPAGASGLDALLGSLTLTEADNSARSAPVAPVAPGAPTTPSATSSWTAAEDNALRAAVRLHRDVPDRKDMWRAIVTTLAAAADEDACVDTPTFSGVARGKKDCHRRWKLVQKRDASEEACLAAETLDSVESETGRSTEDTTEPSESSSARTTKEAKAKAAKKTKTKKKKKTKEEEECATGETENANSWVEEALPHKLHIRLRDYQRSLRNDLFEQLGVSFGARSSSPPSPSSSPPSSSYTSSTVIEEVKDSSVYPSPFSASSSASFSASSAASTVAYLPTGGGKTLLACDVMHRFATGTAKSCLFVVNRTCLLEQTAAALLRCGIGSEGAGFAFIKGGGGAECDEEPSVPIYIATIQTLLARLKNHPTAPVARNVGFIVLDEAHGAYADTYVTLLQRHPSALVLGLTATPFRTQDNELLSTIFRAPVWGPSIKELIRNKWLVMPSVVHCGATRTTIMSRAAALEDRAVRMAVAAWRRHCCGTGGSNGASRRGGQAGAGVFNGRHEGVNVAEERGTGGDGDVDDFDAFDAQLSTVAFCVSVDHSLRLVDALAAAGCRAAHVDGSTPKRERQALFQRFHDGDISLLSSVKVLTEGFDEPRVGAVIMLQPTKSHLTYIQQIGRGLRPSPGKTQCVVLDVVGNCRRHGSPLADVKDKWRRSNFDGVARRRTGTAGGVGVAGGGGRGREKALQIVMRKAATSEAGCVALGGRGRKGNTGNMQRGNRLAGSSQFSKPAASVVLQRSVLGEASKLAPPAQTVERAKNAKHAGASTAAARPRTTILLR